MESEGPVEQGKEGALQWILQQAVRSQPFFLVISLVNPRECWRLWGITPVCLFTRGWESRFSAFVGCVCRWVGGCCVVWLSAQEHGVGATAALHCSTEQELLSVCCLSTFPFCQLQWQQRRQSEYTHQQQHSVGPKLAYNARHGQLFCQYAHIYTATPQIRQSSTFRHIVSCPLFSSLFYLQTMSCSTLPSSMHLATLLTCSRVTYSCHQLSMSH